MNAAYCNMCFTVVQGVSEGTDISKSALRSRQINNFIELWFLVASGSLGINQFSKKLHWLASTASDRKGAKIQFDIS